jgi:hypothetical protein
MEDYVKRYVTKDGKQRLTIYRDEHADNPRYNTDEPLHCEDWCREYSIMDKKDCETKSSSALELIRYLLEKYGNVKEMVGVLRENAKKETHANGDMKLTYDASRHEWILSYWIDKWTDYSGEIHGNRWSEETSWSSKLKDLDAYDIASYLSKEMIEEFADQKYFTDAVKIGSYEFRYYGYIVFYDEFNAKSDGICWLEKEEFLKYSGCKEEYWKSKTLKEIEWLCEEITAWSEGEVYGYVVENAVRIQGVKTYFDGEREDEPYVEEQWEEEDSCWGFYGELDKSIDWILETAGFKKEELIEE